MRAGALRGRVIFQRSVHGQDAIGGLTDSWVEVDSVRADVTRLTGREMYRDGTIAQQPAQIACRFGSELGNLTPDDRVLVPSGYTATTSAVTATGTSLKVSSAAEFPPAQTPTGTTSVTYRVRVESELMTITAGHGSTIWTVTRGADGTTAATHASASTVVYMEPLDIDSVTPAGKSLEVMAVRNV